MTRIKKFVEKIKEEILGKDYDLSVCFVSKNKIKSLNKKYRGKDEPTDILSFNLSNSFLKKMTPMGEIFICPTLAKEKAKKFDPTTLKISEKVMNYENYLLFLVIHGMLHLKGLEHGDKMNAYEFTYHSRYRRRHL